MYKTSHCLFYTLNKVRRIIPYVIAISLLNIVFGLLTHQLENDTELIMEKLLFSLFINGVGIVENYTWQLWFICCMVMVLPIIGFLINSTRLRNFYLYIIAPILPMIYYTWFGISASSNYVGLFRAFFGIMVGTDIFLVTKWIQGFRLNKASRNAITIIEFITFFHIR